MTGSKIFTISASNNSEQKKALTEKAPNEIPKPPRLGVFLLCELLSLGLAVRFLMTLILIIIGKICKTL